MSGRGDSGGVQTFGGEPASLAVRRLFKGFLGRHLGRPLRLSRGSLGVGIVRALEITGV